MGSNIPKNAKHIINLSLIGCIRMLYALELNLILNECCPNMDRKPTTQLDINV